MICEPEIRLTEKPDGDDGGRGIGRAVELAIERGGKWPPCIRSFGRIYTFRSAMPPDCCVASLLVLALEMEDPGLYISDRKLWYVVINAFFFFFFLILSKNKNKNWFINYLLSLLQLTPSASQARLCLRVLQTVCFKIFSALFSSLLLFLFRKNTGSNVVLF